MKKLIINLFIIFLNNIGIAQINIKELEDVNICMDHIKEIKIYRQFIESFPNNRDSIPFDYFSFDKKYNLDTLNLYKQVLFDSCTGRINSIRTDFKNNNKDYFEEKYIYNCSGFCVVEQGDMGVYNVNDDNLIFGTIISENYIYNTEGKLCKKIIISSLGETLMKRYIYGASLKCDIIVMTYINNLPFLIYFYAIEYYNPFKVDDD